MVHSYGATMSPSVVRAAVPILFISFLANVIRYLTGPLYINHAFPLGRLKIHWSSWINPPPFSFILYFFQSADASRGSEEGGL